MFTVFPLRGDLSHMVDGDTCCPSWKDLLASCGECDEQHQGLH